MKFTLNSDIAIHVTDLRKSVEFYRDILGFEYIEGDDEFVRFRKGDIDFYINKADAVIPPILSFSVEDINAAKEHLVKSGCKIIKDSEKAIYAKDVNGIVFDFIES